MSAPTFIYPPPTSGGTPVGGSGTVGTIPVWGTTTTTLTDSPLTVSGSNVTGAGAIRATGTSAVAPAFTGSDTDTGMYFPANNQVRFSTNGALAIAVDASQNVGIGTASPGAQLHVERTGGNVANTEYIRLRNTSGGNGSNATLAFQVAGNAVTTGSMSHTFVSASATYDTSFSVWNGSALGEAMRITGPTGNVGIGTASPGAQLHISRAGGTSNAEYIRLQNTTAAAGSAVGINFWQNNAATTVGRIEGTVTAGGSYDTAFYNWNGSALAEGMRLTGTGNVGIGTASPSAKLEVPFTGSLAGMRIQISSANYFNATNHFFRTLGDNNLVQISGNYIDAAFQASYGLKLPATPGNTDPNTLDAYADGGTANSGGVTWTPTLAFGGASVAIVYDTQVGRYTRIGNMIFAHCYIKISNKGSSTGNATIGGLPTSANLTNLRAGAGIGNVANITFADQIFVRIGANATAVTLTETTNAGVETALTDADFSATSEISFTISYPVI